VLVGLSDPRTPTTRTIRAGYTDNFVCMCVEREIICDPLFCFSDLNLVIVLLLSQYVCVLCSNMLFNIATDGMYIDVLTAVPRDRCQCFSLGLIAFLLIPTDI